MYLHALTSTIAAAMSEAIKDAMATQHEASVARDTAAAQQVKQVVEQEISTITTGRQGRNP